MHFLSFKIQIAGYGKKQPIGKQNKRGSIINVMSSLRRHVFHNMRNIIIHSKPIKVLFLNACQATDLLQHRYKYHVGLDSSQRCADVDLH